MKKFCLGNFKNYFFKIKGGVVEIYVAKNKACLNYGHNNTFFYLSLTYLDL